MASLKRKLTSNEERFILHWGEMGAKWGIPRVVAQIHALILISKDPLNAEDISDLLSVARSNISTGLHELQNWGLVTVVHLLGDRRDYFERSGDIIKTVMTIVDKRFEKEISPTLKLLSELLAEKSPPYFTEQVRELHDLVKSGLTLYEKIKGLPPALIKKLLKLEGKLVKLLGG